MSRRWWMWGWSACVICGGLYARPSAAHPFDADLYGEQVDIFVDAEEIRLRVASEVPSRVIVEDLIARYGAARRSPAEVEAFNALWLDELIGGFSIHIAASPVAWDRRPPPELAAELQARFAVYRFELAAALATTETLGINIIDANFPDQRAVRMVALSLDPRWRLDACSLLQVGPDGTLQDRTGRWAQRADDREIRLTIQPRPWGRWQLGRLGRVLRGAAPDAPLAAAAALPGADLPDVLRGLFGVVLAATALVGATAAGVWGRGRLQKSRAQTP